MVPGPAHTATATTDSQDMFKFLRSRLAWRQIPAIKKYLESLLPEFIYQFQDLFLIAPVVTEKYVKFYIHSLQAFHEVSVGNLGISAQAQARGDDLVTLFVFLGKLIPSSNQLFGQSQ